MPGWKIICSIGWIMLILAASWPQSSVWAGKAPDQQMRDALRHEQQVQHEVHTWSQEKRDLVQQILSLKTKEQWLQLQNKQYTAYAQQKEQAIERLQEQKHSAESLRMKLDPYLSRVVERWGKTLAADLPFLPSERRDRLQFMRSSLTEYGVNLSERLRRVVEGLSVEAGYGTTVEVTDREVEVEGQKTLVQVVRIGRIGLFYVNQEGTKAGVWSEKTGSWRPLSQDTAAELQKTVDIVRGQRAAELVRLPVGRPEDTTAGEAER